MVENLRPVRPPESACKVDRPVATGPRSFGSTWHVHGYQNGYDTFYRAGARVAPKDTAP